MRSPPRSRVKPSPSQTMRMRSSPLKIENGPPDATRAKLRRQTNGATPSAAAAEIAICSLTPPPFFHGMRVYADRSSTRSSSIETDAHGDVVEVALADAQRAPGDAFALEADALVETNRR